MLLQGNLFISFLDTFHILSGIQYPGFFFFFLLLLTMVKPDLLEDRGIFSLEICLTTLFFVDIYSSIKIYQNEPKLFTSGILPRFVHAESLAFVPMPFNITIGHLTRTLAIISVFYM